jgi:hypothetical protein
MTRLRTSVFAEQEPGKTGDPAPFRLLYRRFFHRYRRLLKAGSLPPSLPARRKAGEAKKLPSYRGRGFAGTAKPLFPPPEFDPRLKARLAKKRPKA